MKMCCKLRAALYALPLLIIPSALAAEKEWQVGIDTTLEGSAGLSGGNQRGQALQGLALLHAEWTPDAAPGTTAYSGSISFLGLTGRGPSERYLGDFFAASNIEGYRSARLYSWWLQASRGAWSLRAGALLADAEFTGTAVGGNFFNSAFGWPAFISANTINTGPAFFVAAPGLRAERTWGETAAWRLGIYDGDAFDSPAGDPRITRHGLHYQLGGAQGWFLVSEAVVTLAGGTTRLKVGGWFHTAEFADVRDDDLGGPFATSGRDPRAHDSNHGAYATIERMLAGKPGQAGSIEGYVRVGAAPDDRNPLDWAIDAGFGWTGAIPSRPNDVLGLGIAHAHFGGPLAEAAKLSDPSVRAPDYEQAIELTYAAHISDHLTLQPDVQYIHHPGGSNANGAALAVFVRLTAAY